MTTLLHTFPNLAVLLGGGALAFGVYALAAWGISWTSGRNAASRLMSYRDAGQQRVSGAEAWSERLAGQILSLKTWQHTLRWAQRGGKYRGQSLGGIFLQSGALGALGVLLVTQNPAPAALFFPFILAYLPLARLKNTASGVMRDVVRALPATASLVAAEIAAGNSAEQAVQRASALPGPLSVLFAEVLAAARKTGRPVFSQGTVHGAFGQVFESSGLTELKAFSSQLNLVAAKGVQGAELMSGIAAALADEYQGFLLAQVEKLESRLTIYVGIFFFFPFLAVLMGSLAVPLMQSLGG